MSNRFLHFFPLPKFLAMPAVGLSLSDATLRTIEFRPGKHSAHAGRNNLTVHSWSEQALPEGVIVHGLVTSPEKLTDILSKTAREQSITWARFALPEEKCFVYKTQIVFPVADAASTNATAQDVKQKKHIDDELIAGIVPRDAVAATLAQNIPLPPAETIFDFSVLSVDTKARTADVVVYAFPLALATTYADIFMKAGITPLSFETESQSIARAVLERGKTGSDMIVHFMRHKTIIAIVANGRVVYASTIAHPAQNESLDLLTVRDELLKVASYWHSERGREKPERIQSVVVSGNVEKMLDVPDYISHHVRIPSRLADVWHNAFSTDDEIPTISFEQSLAFAPAVGLAIAQPLT